MTKIKIGSDKSEKFIILFICMVGILLILCSVLIYTYRIKRIQAEKYEYLLAVGKLKLDQINFWLSGKIGEAGVIMDSPYLINELPKWLKNRNDSISYGHILKRLKSYNSNFKLDDILISDEKGENILSVISDTLPFNNTLKKSIIEVFKSNNLLALDFTYCDIHHKVHFEVIVPFQDNTGKTIAAGILRINPEEYIFQLIKSWPTPSKTAETLIIERKGDSVLFINKLRHVKNDYLNFTLPLDRLDLPAAQAIRGRTGIFEGKDYRGEGVLSDLRPIPNTNWFLVTKIDKKEIFTGIRNQTIILISFIVIVLLVFGLGILWYFSYKEKRIFQKLFNSEKDLNKTREEFRTTLYSIGDAVIITDLNGLVLNMNMVAEDMTGWSENEARGKSLKDIFKIINEESRIPLENPVDIVLRRGSMVGLANHTLLISKNGSELPIADSAAPIRNDDGSIQGVVLVFRDQSVERASEVKIHQIASELQSILDNMINAFIIWESVFDEKGEYVSFKFGYFNNAYAQISKLNYNDVKGKDVFEVWPDNEKSWLETYREIALTGVAKTFEMYHKPTDGFYYCNAYRPASSPDKICVIFEDITLQKQAQKALKENQERLNNILQSTPMGIHQYHLEADHRLVFEGANNSANKILGVDHSGFIGKTIEEAFPELINTQIPEAYRRAASEGVAYETESVEYHDNRIVGAFEVYAFQVSPNRMAAQFHDITERKKAEEKVRETQILLQASIESTNDIIIFSVDRDYKLLYFNTAFKKVMVNLYNSETEVGDNLLELIHSEPDRSNAKEAFDLALQGKNHTLVNIFGKVEQRYFETRYNPIIDERRGIVGVASFGIDITEAKAMQEALKDSEERFRVSFMTSPDAININRLSDGLYVNINDGFTNLAGYTWEDIKNKTSLDINIWESAKDRDVLLRMLKEQGFVENLEANFRTKNGEIKTCLMSANLINLNGSLHILSITRDITERKKAIEEINRLNAELEERVVERTLQLVEANKELEAFAYTVSHDLRAPLRAIDGFARILSEEYGSKIDDEANRLCSVIQENASRMGELIDDLLTFSRLSRTEMNFHELDMKDVVDSALNDLLPFAKDNLIKIEIKRLAKVIGDHSMMRQVWINLISNAIKFTSKKPDPHIIISSEKVGNEYVFSIQDNGAGFDNKYMNKLFGVFQRLHNQNEFEGTGVGLAIVHRIITRHCGKIWADAEPGKGATFYFSLPEFPKNKEFMLT